MCRVKPWEQGIYSLDTEAGNASLPRSDWFPSFSVVNDNTYSPNPHAPCMHQIGGYRFGDGRIGFRV